MPELATPSVTDIESISQAAQARLETDLERLAGYVAMETPTGSRAALDGFADRVAADLALARASARLVPLTGGAALVADLPCRGRAAAAPPAVLLAHHDTVHPQGSVTGPMPVRRDDDLLYGPGVYDMKGGLVVAISALELLRRLDHRPVRLIMTPDEEIGSPSSAELVLAEAAGAGYVLGLEPPHPDGALKTERRGSTRWRVETFGRASHAALDPDGGVNAVAELVDQTIAVRRLLSRYPDVLVNLGAISGGGRTNVVPDHAWADYVLCLGDAVEEEAVLAELADLRPVRPGAQVVSTVLTRRPAWRATRDCDDLLAAVTAAGRRVAQRVDGRSAVGAADTNLTGAAGIPSLDGFGPVGAGAHAPDERIEVASVAQRVTLVTAVLATV